MAYRWKKSDMNTLFGEPGPKYEWWTPSILKDIYNDPHISSSMISREMKKMQNEVEKRIGERINRMREILVFIPAELPLATQIYTFANQVLDSDMSLSKRELIELFREQRSYVKEDIEDAIMELYEMGLWEK